jgi:hypothetical protein
MVANNEASKEGMTSTDASNVEECRRTFTLEPTPMTRATNRSFGDAFSKVNDACCTTAAAPKREAGQSSHPRACSPTFSVVSLGPGHRPLEARAAPPLLGGIHRSS